MKQRTTLTQISIERGQSPLDIVLEALNSADTKIEAAESLDVTRCTLDNWIKRLNIQTEYVTTKNPQKSA